MLDLMLMCSKVRAFQEHFDNQRASLILLTTGCGSYVVDTVLHIPYPHISPMIAESYMTQTELRIKSLRKW